MSDCCIEVADIHNDKDVHLAFFYFDFIINLFADISIK
jgi:hypothetical protein